MCVCAVFVYKRSRSLRVLHAYAYACDRYRSVILILYFFFRLAFMCVCVCVCSEHFFGRRICVFLLFRFVFILAVSCYCCCCSLYALFVFFRLLYSEYVRFEKAKMRIFKQIHFSLTLIIGWSVLVVSVVSVGLSVGRSVGTFRIY